MSIKARNLTRTFGDKTVVSGVSLNLSSGQITGLVGPNGAGKTTLLLLLSGLLAPDEGEIEIEGVSMSANPSSARKLLGWMPDDFGVWESLTVFEILEAFGQAYGLRGSELLHQIAHVLALVEMEDYRRVSAQTLSRGQKQRLGLARSLMGKPRVLLLDEPANGLDPIARLELKRILQDLAAEGITILISSHVLSELEEMCDDTIFMNHGQVVVPEEDQAELFPWLLRLDKPEIFTNWAEEFELPYQVRKQRGRDYFEIMLATDDDATLLRQTMEMLGANISELFNDGSSLERKFLSLEPEDPLPLRSERDSAVSRIESAAIAEGELPARTEATGETLVAGDLGPEKPVQSEMSAQPGREQDFQAKTKEEERAIPEVNDAV
ncbi:hypothetical protein BK816_00885 [Boudabousia tangfeifanii]|uniref:ABC transporter domain-containing protein n=1 Tax=Boudabousia tangfeifanii TaxID=1912795 RepID=A0A1D9MIB7_9ACTO|nr:ABC transporter ATP-binding protein [Boudabousia tangfeifanii]AOZ72026.1 hypothetical protein BK816_00885 [Boudabousia tangfeifanii]